MDLDLKNMRLLVFAPAFFYYEKAIVMKLQSMGAHVTFYDERPSNSTFGKSILRVSKKISRGIVNRYYKKICRELKMGKFEQIIFFQAEATPRWFLEFINKDFKEARKVLYLWDSVSDKPDSISDLDLYDEVYSFDPQDCKKYGLKFRPLFFTDDYLKKTEREDRIYKFDFSFIGTVRKDRYDLLQEMRFFAKQSNQKYYIFYYLQSRILYYYYKIIRKNFKKGSIKDFSFVPLSHREIQEIISQTRVLVDIQKPNQVGLTIRTLELIASNKKFVTTNSEISKYNFYSKNNIAVLSRERPVIPNSLVTSKFIPIDKSVLDKYSIGFFLKEVLGLVEVTDDYYTG